MGSIKRILYFGIILSTIVGFASCDSTSNPAPPSPQKVDTVALKDTADSQAVHIAQPSITPKGETFKDSITVILADSTAGVSIRYTTDGRTPDANSNLYTRPLVFKSSTALKVVAILNDVPSRIDSANFTLMVPDTIPWNTTITYGRLEDARDGKVYRTVMIGDQTWMAENLAYRNTTGTNDSVGMCYNDSKDSCEKYGRLYLWTEALSLSSSLDERSWQGTYPHQGVCPSGWHVPTDSEWTKLVKFVGGTATAGTKLKSTAGWSKGLGRSDNGTDQYGFRLLPGGSLLAKLSYRVSGTEADLWSSTEGNRYQGELWYAYASSPYLEVYSDNKKNRNSVRCVED